MTLSKYYRKILRTCLNKNNKKRLKNKNFTILCNNCVAGVILHELGEKFNTPTINLWFEASDYIKFLENLDYYLSQPLIEIKSNEDYPVAKLHDIKIYFMHYKSFDEAKIKWEQRVNRINKENLYLIFVQREGCTEDLLKRFDNLPYRNKVAFTSKTMSDIKCSYYIDGSAQRNGEVMDLCSYKGDFTGKRWIDDFDYVSFLNKKDTNK